MIVQNKLRYNNFGIYESIQEDSIYIIHDRVDGIVVSFEFYFNKLILTIEKDNLYLDLNNATRKKTFSIIINDINLIENIIRSIKVIQQIKNNIIGFSSNYKKQFVFKDEKNKKGVVIRFDVRECVEFNGDINNKKYQESIKIMFNVGNNNIYVDPYFSIPSLKKELGLIEPLLLCYENSKRKNKKISETINRIFKPI